MNFQLKLKCLKLRYFILNLSISHNIILIPVDTDDLTEHSTVQSEVQTFSNLLQKSAVE